MTSIHLQAEDIPEVRWEGYVVETDTTTEERGDLTNSVASDATAYSRNEKAEFWVLGGKLGEALYCSLHALKTFHRRNGIALSLQTHALTHDSAEFFNGYSSCATGMHTCKVAAEDEYLVVLQAFDVLRRDAAIELAHLMVVLGGAVFHATVGLAFFS